MAVFGRESETVSGEKRVSYDAASMGERTEKGEALSSWECCWLAWCWRGAGVGALCVRVGYGNGPPLSGLKLQAHRLLRTANRGSITISRRTACMGFRTRPRMVSKSRSQTVIHAACRGSHAPLSVTGGTRILRAAGACVTVHGLGGLAPLKAQVCGGSLCARKS